MAYCRKPIRTTYDSLGIDEDLPK